MCIKYATMAAAVRNHHNTIDNMHNAINVATVV